MSIVERERVETEVAPVTTKEVLHRAADLLEEFGWLQGELAVNEAGMCCGVNSGVAFCVGGAYMRALTDLGRDSSDLDWNDDLEPLRIAMAIEDEHVQFWNDAPGRTKAEVVTRLRNAANAL